MEFVVGEEQNRTSRCIKSTQNCRTGCQTMITQESQARLVDNIASFCLWKRKEAQSYFIMALKADKSRKWTAHLPWHWFWVKECGKILCTFLQFFINSLSTMSFVFLDSYTWNQTDAIRFQDACSGSRMLFQESFFHIFQDLNWKKGVGFTLNHFELKNCTIKNKSQRNCK